MGIINHLDPKTCISYCNIEHVYTAVYIQDRYTANVFSKHSITFISKTSLRPGLSLLFVLYPQAQALNFFQETLKALIAIRSSSVILVASWYYTPCRRTLSVKVVLSLQPRFIILVGTKSSKLCTMSNMPMSSKLCTKNTQKRPNPKI